MPKKKKLLIISQVYVPDPAAVGQYMHDVGAEMVKRGWDVLVYSANRGYDNPAVRYDAREVLDGVMIKRFPLSSFGKKTFLLRLTAATLFMIQAIGHGLFSRGISRILVSTSPPMCSLAAVFISFFRRVPIKYWVMDINPDQMVELGHLEEKSLPVKVFNWINRLILGRAEDIVALDQFMRKRLVKKLDVSSKIAVIPPWPHDNHLEKIGKNNIFREKYGLAGKFIFMYSGNHTYANPVSTFLEAARELQDKKDVLFMFIGGGLAKGEIDEMIMREKPSNIVSLPYQPFETTKYSLAAADVHLVVVGEKMVGVVHPSKIYGAMAVGRPVLLVGPDPCHASQVIRDYNIGWQVKHGDVKGTVKTIHQIIETPGDKLKEMGVEAIKVVEGKYNRDKLLKQFCDIVEK